MPMCFSLQVVASDLGRLLKTFSKLTLMKAVMIVAGLRLISKIELTELDLTVIMYSNK